MLLLLLLVLLQQFKLIMVIRAMKLADLAPKTRKRKAHGKEYYSTFLFALLLLSLLLWKIWLILLLPARTHTIIFTSMVVQSSSSSSNFSRWHMFELCATTTAARFLFGCPADSDSAGETRIWQMICIQAHTRLLIHSRVVGSRLPGRRR